MLRFQFRAVAVGLGRRDGFKRYLRVWDREGGRELQE